MGISKISDSQRVWDMATLNTLKTKELNRSVYRIAVLQNEGGDKPPHFHIFGNKNSFNVEYDLTGKLIEIIWGEKEYKKYKKEIDGNKIEFVRKESL